ncbi:MAG: metalloregulator ArsR/SmtB family transcription factor [Chloroflexota bacterium]|nr:metalloregulator ArsR/SmtB family transcription factor [Chloroflexota bacterium]
MGEQRNKPRPDTDIWRELKELRDYFRALGDVIRLEIIHQLACADEISVSQLADTLHLSQPLVSWHLARLKKAGLIKVRREGRQSHYSLVWQQILQLQQDFARLIGEPPCRDPGRTTGLQPSSILTPLTSDFDEGEAWV